MADKALVHSFLWKGPPDYEAVDLWPRFTGRWRPVNEGNQALEKAKVLFQDAMMTTRGRFRILVRVSINDEHKVVAWRPEFSFMSRMEAIMARLVLDI